MLTSSARWLAARRLAKDPRQRPANAEELLLDLRPLEGIERADEIPLARTVELTASLTAREQTLVSVVFAAPPVALGDVAALPGSGEVPIPLEPHAVPPGAHVEQLADGSLVATLAAAGSAMDQAVQAARYALVLHERWPHARIALATGRGQIRDSIPVGEAIDRAAQLLHTARALSEAQEPAGATDGVSLDALSAGLLDQRFDITQRGGLRLLLGERAHVSATRLLLGKPSPYVGREQELSLLESVLRTCAEESRGRAVLVVGAPGVGKSRLWHELLRRFQPPPGELPAGELLLARGDALASGRPYGVLVQTLRRLCEVRSLTDPQALRAALLSRVTGKLDAAAAEHVVTFLCEMCGISVPEEQDADLQAAHKDPLRMAEQIRLAFCDFMRARCATQPVLFVVEDLQWADPQSVQILGDVLVELLDQPLVLLGLARPEVHERFGALWGGLAQEVPLRGLSRKASERLLHHVFGKGADPQLVARLIEQSAGNALYLEELIRAAAEGRTEVPETVLAMLQARVQPLPPELRRVLRAASIFGATFWPGGVLALLGPGAVPDELQRCLQALFSLEIIERHRTSRYPGELQYGFRQGLLRDAVYGLLTDEDRRTGHRLAARYLEKVGEIEPLVLIHHYEQAGEAALAFHHYRQAGDAARRLCLFAGAQQHYQSALAGLRRCPERDEERRQRVDLIVKLVETGVIADRRTDLLPLLAEAEAVLQPLASPSGLSEADEIRRAWIDYLTGRVHYFSGNPAESLRSYRKVLSIGQRVRKKEFHAYPAALVGTALMNQGYADRAEHWLRLSLLPLEQLEDRWEWLRAMGYLGLAQLAQGNCSDGQAHLVRSQSLAEGTTHLTSLTMSLAMAGDLFTGDYQAAVARARKVEALYPELNDPVHLFAAYCTLATASAYLGHDTDEVRGYLDRAEDLGRELSGRVVLFDWCLSGLAETAALLGDRERTERIAEQVLGLARRLDSRMSLGAAERALALVKARTGAPSAEVDDHLAVSLAAYRDGKLRVPEALTEATRAILLKQRGDTAAAARFTEAVTQLVRYGCTAAVDHVERRWRASEPVPPPQPGPGPGPALSPPLHTGSPEPTSGLQGAS